MLRRGAAGVGKTSLVTGKGEKVTFKQALLPDKGLPCRIEAMFFGGYKVILLLYTQILSKEYAVQTVRNSQVILYLAGRTVD